MYISRYANIDKFVNIQYIFLEILKKKYRNRILELGTTISGFADSKKKKIFNDDRP
jgi:hypothetical protein